MGMYNNFLSMPYIPYRIIEYLAYNNENIWKILKYNTYDCLSEENLTFEEKMSLIWSHQADQENYRIFFTALVENMIPLSDTMIKIYKDIREDYTSAYPIYPNGTFRLKNKGIFTIGLFVAEKNIVYLAIWKINTEESKLTVDLSKYGSIKKADKLYPELNNYDLTCSGNEITAEFPDGNCAMLVKIEY